MSFELCSIKTVLAMEQRTGGKQVRAEAGEGWTEPAGTLNLDLPAPGTVRSVVSVAQLGALWLQRPRQTETGGHGDGPAGDGGGHAQGTDRTPSQRRLPGFQGEQQVGDDVTGEERAFGRRWRRQRVLSGAWEARIAWEGLWAAHVH